MWLFFAFVSAAGAAAIMEGLSGTAHDDEQDERIHSSDDDPREKPPVPQILYAGDDGGVLRGSGAGDTLIGGAGDDTLIGNGGDVKLVAGSGDNHLIGAEGEDTLIGGSGDDTLQGGAGNDLLIGGGGSNVMFGGGGDDTLVGAHLDKDGRDTSGPGFLNGGAGDDLLIAGQGDMLSGGEGEDIFALGDWLAGGEPATILDYTAGEDQIALHYDPAHCDAPEISVTHDGDDPDKAEIRLDGQVIAYVVNAPHLTAGDIGLESSLPDALIAAQ
ncbi:MAG: hypothetical protein JJU09_11830 [Rhodobacteraceae bacterium]|nr:hypothetical protein [Paracoccaceae bacterium]